ncbi:class I SAM-dependent methyltransferase [Kribbella deserti]|uniref:Class I SAM-dependent methyltransferase n=1 Tax=Kribbella deserti TaxID=1926257 RepID=A0ABV6QNS8_9ACTN
MTDDARRQREADLITYYDNETTDRVDRELPEWRVAKRDDFLELLRREQRKAVLEVGTGPGRDAQAFVDAGLDFRGVDLAPGSVEICRELGLDVQVGSVLDLPFETEAFDAGWTMSTLLHVSDADLPNALAELARVLKPGAPLALGLWGHPDWTEGPSGDSDYGPPRFFSFRSDETLHHQLSTIGQVEQTDRREIEGPFHYQWAVVRVGK